MFKLELDGDCYKEKTIEINKGITILTGPNGSGKTYACTQIHDYMEENKIKHLFINVYNEGKTVAQSFLEYGNMKALIKHTASSEGQRVYDVLVDNHIGEIGNYVRGLVKERIKDGYVIIDGCDSGVSIDMLLDIRDILDFILEDCIKSEIDMHLIVTSNSYELIPHYDCIWIPTMEHYKHGDEADGYNLWKHRFEEHYKITHNK